MSSAIVGVTGTPNMSAFVFDLIGEFHDYGSVVRRANDLLLAPLLHIGIERVVGKVAAPTIGKKNLFGVY